MRSRRQRTFILVTSAAFVALLAGSSSQIFAQAAATKQGAAKAQAKPAVAGQAAAKTQPVKPVDPDAQRKMEELLVRWEAQSKSVKSLKVHYKRVDLSVLFGETTEYEGDARLMSPNLVYLDFYQMVAGKQKAAFSERIVCDDKNVYQFLGDTKQVFIFPLDQNPKNKALDQGPLPFLFNMSVAKAKERYAMLLDSEDAKYYKIRIVPKLAIDKEEYSEALVVLDRTRFMPVAIRLWAPQGKDTKSFTFTDGALLENVAIPPTWFDGPTMVKQVQADKWKVIVNPGPNDLHPPGAGAAAPARDPKAAAAGAVGAKPAAKNAGVRQR